MTSNFLTEHLSNIQKILNEIEKLKSSVNEIVNFQTNIDFTLEYLKSVHIKTAIYISFSEQEKFKIIEDNLQYFLNLFQEIKSLKEILEKNQSNYSKLQELYNKNINSINQDFTLKNLNEDEINSILYSLKKSFSRETKIENYRNFDGSISHVKEILKTIINNNMIDENAFKTMVNKYFQDNNMGDFISKNSFKKKEYIIYIYIFNNFNEALKKVESNVQNNFIYKIAKHIQNFNTINPIKIINHNLTKNKKFIGELETKLKSLEKIQEEFEFKTEILKIDLTKNDFFIIQNLETIKDQFDKCNKNSLDEFRNYINLEKEKLKSQDLKNIKSLINIIESEKIKSILDIEEVKKDYLRDASKITEYFTSKIKKLENKNKKLENEKKELQDENNKLTSSKESLEQASKSLSQFFKKKSEKLESDESFWAVISSLILTFIVFITIVFQIIYINFFIKNYQNISSIVIIPIMLLSSTLIGILILSLLSTIKQAKQASKLKEMYDSKESISSTFEIFKNTPNLEKYFFDVLVETIKEKPINYIDKSSELEALKIIFKNLNMSEILKNDSKNQSN